MKRILTITPLLLLPASMNAAVLADMTLAEWTNTAASGGATHIATTFSATTTLDANIDSIAGGSVNSVGGTHTVGGSGSNAGEINWALWTNSGPAATNYFSVVVNPSVGFGVDLDDFTISVARNGVGAPKDLYVWVVSGTYAGAALTTGTADANVQLTNGGLDVQNGGIVTNNNKVFDLSGVAQQNSQFSIVFGARLLDDETVNGQGNLRINDVVINGATIAVPEPSSAALLGLGGLALILRRRH